MSEVIVEPVSPADIGEQAAASAVHGLWRQWAMINPVAAAGGVRRTLCVIDPEALVLASGVLAERERRFVDMLAWLAEAGSGLLSVQRTRTLFDTLPGAEGSANSFAYWAVHLGKDRRWQSLAAGSPKARPRHGKGPERPRLDDRAALMFRLRAGFGVGVKADLLTYLLCLQGEGRSAAEIADVIGYTGKTVRIAVRELQLAGFVEEEADYPTRYSTPPEFANAFVASLYGRTGDDLPEWCYWPQVFAFLLYLARWKDDPGLASNAYLASSAARDLFSKFEATFRALGVRMPRPEPHPGSAYLPVFAEFVTRLESWMEREAHG